MIYSFVIVLHSQRDINAKHIIPFDSVEHDYLAAWQSAVSYAYKKLTKEHNTDWYIFEIRGNLA